MVLALVIASVLLILLSIIMGVFVVQRRLIDRSYYRERALALAESGIDVAIAYLNNNEDVPEQISGEIPEMGNFLVQISASASMVTITSTGYSKRKDKEKAQREVEVVVSLDTVFNIAAFAGGNEGNTITIEEGAGIDSYDSEGTGQLYDPANPGSEGHIGTNSKSTSPEAVKIEEDGNINGNVYIGAGGDVDKAIDKKGNVYGELLALNENRELPQVDPPSIPPDFFYEEELKVEEGESKHVYDSSHYGSISVGEESHLTFDTGTTFIYVEGDMSIKENADTTIATDMTLYVAGNLTLAEGAKIEIQNGHKLIIYTGGDIQIQEDNFVNPSENSLNLTIYGLGNCTSVSFEEGTNFYGAIYARNASIEMQESVGIYGSIVGEKIYIQEDTFIHYDKALNNLDKNPDALTYDYYVIRQWEEIR